MISATMIRIADNLAALRRSLQTRDEPSSGVVVPFQTAAEVNKRIDEEILDRERSAALGEIAEDTLSDLEIERWDLVKRDGN